MIKLLVGVQCSSCAGFECCTAKKTNKHQPANSGGRNSWVRPVGETLSKFSELQNQEVKPEAILMCSLVLNVG